MYLFCVFGVIILFLVLLGIMGISDNTQEETQKEENENQEIDDDEEENENQKNHDEEKINEYKTEEESEKNTSEELRRKEQEEVEKMSEEMKENFYEYKKICMDNLRKVLEREGATDEKIEQALSNLNYIELFNAEVKNQETKICLQAICDNCMIMENVHNLAYELNPEYKILWDNLNEEAKKQFLKARKMNKFVQNTEKARWGFATMGLSALGAKALKGRQENKIIEYVTSEGFTNLCIIVNKNNEYYKKEKKENEC